MSWLQNEIGTAFCLSVGMGTVLGLVAFFASGYDAGFTVSLLAGQIISITTAGLTGTLAPLLITLIFHREDDKWTVLMITAIQDIVASLTMVLVSYHLLILFGSDAVDPDDV